MDIFNSRYSALLSAFRGALFGMRARNRDSRCLKKIKADYEATPSICRHEESSLKRPVWYDFLHFFCVLWPRLCEHEEDDISRGVWCTAHRGGASVSLTLLLLLFWHAEDPLKLQKDPENVYCPPRAQAKTSVVPKTLRVVKRSGSCPWKFCTEPRLFLFHM